MKSLTNTAIYIEGESESAKRKLYTFLKYKGFEVYDDEVFIYSSNITYPWLCLDDDAGCWLEVNEHFERLDSLIKMSIKEFILTFSPKPIRRRIQPPKDHHAN